MADLWVLNSFTSSGLEGLWLAKNPPSAGRINASFKHTVGRTSYGGMDFDNAGSLWLVRSSGQILQADVYGDSPSVVERGTGLSTLMVNGVLTNPFTQGLAISSSGIAYILAGYSDVPVLFAIDDLSNPNQTRMVGSLPDSIRFPGGQVAGLSFDREGNLWALQNIATTSGASFSVHKIEDPESPSEVAFSRSFPFNVSRGSRYAGIAIDGKNKAFLVFGSSFGTSIVTVSNLSDQDSATSQQTFGSNVRGAAGIALFEPPPFSGLYTTGTPTIAGRFYKERVQGDTDDLTPIVPRVETKTYSIGMAVADILPIGSGGNGDLAYEVDCDAPGLTFNSRSIGGSPTTLGSYLATYKVTDEDGSEFTRQFYIIIGPRAVSALTIPPVGDKLYFLGDEVDETLPCARGGQSDKVYALSPAIDGIQFSGDRRIKGEATVVGKSIHSYKVTDRAGIVRGNDFTVEVRSLEKRPERMLPEDRFVESRIALHIEPVGTPGQRGHLQGFAFWNGTNNVDVDGVNYSAGEVAGLGSYSVDMQSSDPLVVLLEGADPLFRAWLIAGGSGREATVTFMIREGNEDWDTDLKYVGRVGSVREIEGVYHLQVDSEIYIPSQAGVTRMSDEAQRSIFPNDEVYKNLKVLAAGKKDVFPR